MPESTELRVRRLVAKAINNSLEEVYRKSQDEVPIDADSPDSGALMDSGHISEEATVEHLEGSVSYGTAYGAAQHEGWAWVTRNGRTYLWKVKKYTMPGRKSHFLSDPLKAITPKLEASVAKIVKLGLEEKR